MNRAPVSNGNASRSCWITQPAVDPRYALAAQGMRAGRHALYVV
jgi:hypothetical protein